MLVLDGNESRFSCRFFVPCIKGIIQDIHGVWIPRFGFRISGNGFRILCQWKLDSGFKSLVYSRLLELYPGFYSKHFLDSGVHKQTFPNSEIPYMGRGFI